MTFKLSESAQEHWRAVNAPHLVALVRAGTRFERGLLVERDEATAAWTVLAATGATPLMATIGLR